MDAVLPLVTKDLDRARILFRSLDRFFSDLGAVHVVTPDAQAAPIAESLRGVGRVEVRVVPETQLVPELALFAGVGGWYKQQIIKLAAARHVEGPFYLTLDADVVATRPLRAELLTPGGKALVHVIPDDLHPRWYRRVEALLAAPLRRTGVCHNVTPAVLSTAAATLLVDAMGARLLSGRFSRGLRGLRQRWVALRYGRRADLSPGHLFLLAGLPWTEYALYYSFLEQEGRLEEAHVESPHALYDIAGSVWYRPEDGLAGWDPALAFAGDGPPWFVVVQSNTGLSAVDVEGALARYLGPSPGEITDA